MVANPIIEMTHPIIRTFLIPILFVSNGPIILNAIYIVVNLFTGFEVKYFQWMYATISYIYIIIAILMIKTDLINRQIELQKIYEEQEKVKKELEEQRRKEEEEKKQDPQAGQGLLGRKEQAL